MSFKDDYKNQIESLSADGYLKQKVMNKMSEKEGRKANFFALRTVAVSAVCVLLAAVIAIPNVRDFFGDMFVSSDKTASSETYVVEEEKNTPIKNLKYEEIYDKLSEFASDTEGENYAQGGGIAMYAKDDGADLKGSSSTNGSSKNEGSNYSETTAQVEGVDEADVVKTDGKYIYALNVTDRKIRIIKSGKNPELVSSIYLENPYYHQNMYLYKDRLVIFGTRIESIYQNNKMIDRKASDNTEAYIYDISNPEKPQLLIKCEQSGDYHDSRLIGDKLYIISNYFVNTNDMVKDDVATYVPSIECKGYNGPINAKHIYVNANCSSSSYTVICGYDITDGSLKGSQSVMGGTYAIYCSTENIITAGYEYNNSTAVTRYEIKGGKVTVQAEGEIKGSLLNQFSIDEYKGNFRFVTTYTYGEEGGSDASAASGTVYYKMIIGNMLTVLNGKLDKIGAIEKIAPDERIYSVRFMGDMAYFVTFRQVDPLFSVDLSNPKNPQIVGSLKIPGFSNYLFPYGENLLLGIGQDADEKTGISGGIKLSMFDIKNPSDVTEISKEILKAKTSDALYSHKNALISAEKNIIGFDVYDNGRGYLIYGYENGKFIKRAQIDLGNTGLYAKGLYIDNEFYIVTRDNVLVLDINNFKVIGELKFK